ncbi:MAG: glyoxalase [Acidobacteria bacterium]|jgi:hypothetical protein|nr:glyoxalase [Acidobacteriota bacterium]
MELNNNVVAWFEIPVHDMERAIQFYQTVFGFPLQRQSMGVLDMALFPCVTAGLGTAGALVRHPDFYRPSAEGTLVYFTAHSGDLDQELSRVEAAGGKILMGKKLITNEIGYMALLTDTEGNRIALHSRK